MLIKETNISWSLKRHDTHKKTKKKNNNFIFIKNQASSREREGEERKRGRERMALSTVTYSPAQKGIVISIPTLVLSVLIAAIMLFFLLSSLSTCSCPSSLQSFNDNNNGRGGLGEVDKKERISATQEDIEWIMDQIQANGLHMQDNILRKGINPRTRAQQLQDLIQ